MKNVRYVNTGCMSSLRYWDENQHTCWMYCSSGLLDKLHDHDGYMWMRIFLETEKKISVFKKSGYVWTSGPVDRALLYVSDLLRSSTELF